MKLSTRGRYGMRPVSYTHLTYDADALRLIDEARARGLSANSVVITQYCGQPAAEAFAHKLVQLGIRVYRHYPIEGYPSNLSLIVSPDAVSYTHLPVRRANQSLRDIDIVIIIVDTRHKVK